MPNHPSHLTAVRLRIGTNLHAFDGAAADVQAVYDNLRQAFGRMPNIFAVMAHRPWVLNTFLPLYTAIINEGMVTPKYKELAWMKTSQVNGCAY
jgi:hypothetical protein